MGPKKGKEVIVAGYNIAVMTEEELQDFALKLEEEIEKIREERNFFQVERDKIVQFWEITKQELEAKSAELQVKDKEIEDMKLSVAVQLQENMKKMKQLEYEYNKSLREHEVQKAADVRDMDEQHQTEQNLLMEKIKDHEFTISQMKLHYEDLIRQMKVAQDEELHNNKLMQERKLVDTIVKYENMMLDLQDSMDLQKRVETHEIEDSKNNDIRSFTDTHGQDFERMQGYFKDITLKNLSLISDLKNEIEAVKRNEEEMKNRLNKILKENNSLHHAKLEVNQLKHYLSNYERNKISLSLARKRLTECSERAKALEYENEVLSQTLDSTKKQKEALRNQFVILLRSLQERIGLRNVFLERVIKSFKEDSGAGPSSSEDSSQQATSFSSYLIPDEQINKKPASDSDVPEESSESDKQTLPVNVVNITFPASDVYFNPPGNLKKPGVDVPKL